MAITNEVLDEILKDYNSPEDFTGKKELLGMWIAQTEGAKFWLNVVNELKTRGVQDIFICCIDGLKGFPDAIRTVFPDTEVQLCIVHMVRNSLKFVSYKDRKEVAADLKVIYGVGIGLGIGSGIGSYPIIFS